jgi:hypothetical protein
MPTARLSSAGGKAARSSASVLGISSAPATPCSTRAPISMPVVVDSAHSSDVSAKPTMPIMKTFLRPKRSPSLPPTISSTASASR